MSDIRMLVANPPTMATTVMPMIATAMISSIRVSPVLFEPVRTRVCTVDYTATWPKTPYIADTRAIATKPTTPPMAMITTGSMSEVTFLIL